MATIKLSIWQRLTYFLFDYIKLEPKVYYHIGDGLTNLIFDIGDSLDLKYHVVAPTVLQICETSLQSIKQYGYKTLDITLYRGSDIASICLSDREGRKTQLQIEHTLTI